VWRRSFWEIPVAAVLFSAHQWAGSQFNSEIKSNAINFGVYFKPPVLQIFAF